MIPPLLIGHNLETTRRGTWQGLGAEQVANRKFAAGLTRWTILGPDEGVSMEWAVNISEWPATKASGIVDWRAPTETVISEAYTR